MFGCSYRKACKSTCLKDRKMYCNWLSIICVVIGDHIRLVLNANFIDKINKLLKIYRLCQVQISIYEISVQRQPNFYDAILLPYKIALVRLTIYLQFIFCCNVCSLFFDRENYVKSIFSYICTNHIGLKKKLYG